MEWLGPLFLIAAVIWLLVTLVRSSTGWDSKRVYQQQLAASQAWIDQCVGNGRQMDMICAPVPPGFGTDEEIVFVLPGVHLLESRAVRRSRTAEDLPLRGGAGASPSESGDELRSIDDGTLVLTTRRLAFMGALRTTNASLDDIIGITGSTHGIQVHRARKDRVETYMLSRPVQIQRGSGRGLTVFGPMIMAAIQVAKACCENPARPAVARGRAGTPEPRDPHVEYRRGPRPARYGSRYRSAAEPGVALTA